MMHIRIAVLLGSLAAIPFSLSAISLSPARWFGDEGDVPPKTHDPSHEVTSNGVTKVQMQHLYKSDYIVTDVDMSAAGGGITNLVAGQNIVISDVGDGGKIKRISAVGGGGWTDWQEVTNVADAVSSSNVVPVASAVMSNSFAIADLQTSNRVSSTRIGTLELRADLLSEGITNLIDAIPDPAPYNSYTSFAERVPAIRVRDGVGIGFFVLCTDGLYRDLRDTVGPRRGGRGPSMAFDVTGLYGIEFSATYLAEMLGDRGWTSALVASSENIDSPITSVCGGSLYPPCYGRTATVRELLCDLLWRDQELWSTDSYAGHNQDFVSLGGLRSAVDLIRPDVTEAHRETAQLRHDYETGPAFGMSLSNAVPVAEGPSGSMLSVTLSANGVLSVSVPVEAEFLRVDVPRSDGSHPGKSESFQLLMSVTRRLTVSVIPPSGCDIVGNSTFSVSPGTRLLSVVRASYSSDYGGYAYVARMVELDRFTGPDFTSRNAQLVSTVDSRLSPTNATFVAAVTAVSPSTSLEPATNYANSVAVSATNYTDSATNGVWKDLASQGVVPHVRVVSRQLTDVQRESGATFEHGGTNWNSAVELGMGAKAAADTSGVTGPANLRNVGVAVGFAASVDVPGEPSRSQGVAVGPTARASGYSSVAIGGGVRHFDDEDDMTGDNAYVKGDYSTAIGYGAKAVGNCGSSLGNRAKAFGQGAAAFGCSAVASNDYAVQIGPGVNSQAHSLKFEDTTIISNGSLTAYVKSETDAKLAEKASYADVATEWTVGAAYEKGQVVYVRASAAGQKRLFVCVQTHEDADVGLGDEDYWRPFDEYRFAGLSDIPAPQPPPDYSTNNVELVDTVKTVAGGHTLFVYFGLGGFQSTVTAVRTDGSTVSGSAGGSGFYAENVVNCTITYTGSDSLIFLRVNGGVVDATAYWTLLPDGRLVGAGGSGSSFKSVLAADKHVSFTLTADMAFQIDFD